MAINYAQKYADKVDENFRLGSVTTPAVNEEYDWVGVNTVNVFTVPTVEMADYNPSGTSRYGTPSELQNSVQTLTLARDRAFTFTIDRRSCDDTMMAMEAGKALSRQIEEVAIPEIDVYRLAKLYENAGTKASGAVTKGNAYSEFLTASTTLTENKVPLSNRICFVSPTFYKLIKLDGAFVKCGDMAQATVVKGQLGEIDGIPVVQVPQSYLPEGVNFIMASPVAMVSPIKLAEFKTHDNPPGINGWLVEGRLLYDAFVLSNKKCGIYVQMNAAN